MCKNFFVFYLTTLLFCISSALGVAASFPLSIHAAEFSFERTLKFGSEGIDVQKLQILLNQDPETRISESGPGSPGLETTYFGSFTRNAVIRFQEKNADTILKPNNLTHGTGIVGPSTRAELVSLQNKYVQTHANSSQSDNSGSVATVVPTDPIKTEQFSDYLKNISQQGTDTNTKNLDTFLATYERAAKKNGVSIREISMIKDQIRHDVATTTNLQEQFLRTIQNDIVQIPVPGKGFLAQTLQSLKASFMPKNAKAQSTGSPFGGALIFSYYCTCSATWLVLLEPLPPTFPALLSYMTGTQLFMYNNTPITLWLLGEYIPGAGICTIYVGTGCASVSSEGHITPFLGSSLII